MTMRDGGKDSSEIVVRKKSVKDVGIDKGKVDIKVKKGKKCKNKNAFKCTNDKGVTTVCHFSDNEEVKEVIDDGNDGPVMYCERCQKYVERNEFCKGCADKLSLIHEKNKNNIEKHGLKSVPYWISTTRESIHILEDSIHSLTSKTVPEDLSIVIQDVVSVKDVGGIDELEILSDVVNVEEAVAGMKQLELALVVKEKEEQKNKTKNSVDDKIIGVKEKFEKEANEIPVDNEEKVQKN